MESEYGEQLYGCFYCYLEIICVSVKINKYKESGLMSNHLSFSIFFPNTCGLVIDTCDCELVTCTSAGVTCGFELFTCDCQGFGRRGTT